MITALKKMGKFWISIITVFLLISAVSIAQQAVRPPLPVLPIPTARQLEWQRSELAMFLHFGVNTFTDREWGDGTEDPAIFNPEHLNTHQWVRVAKETGFKTMILTAKHHDGFCLWPSKFTDHSVEASPWRNGDGDVVRELAEATAENLKMGLYLSPWDRHEPTYGEQTAYNEYYIGQLRELLSGYGDMNEVWFDGAKGEDAEDMDYNFDAYWALVRQLQPKAVMFSDEGPDVRWIGNERGIAGETCWSMMDRTRVTVGKADREYLNHGDIDGTDWVPGESDVSIRPGWFWHEDEQPKSVSELMDIYYKSVGRNTVLLLNVPPNDQGLLSRADVTRLYEFKAARDKIFGVDFTVDAAADADNIRGNSQEYSPKLTLDGQMDTFWATEDAVRSATLEITLNEPEIFNVIRIQEPIAWGQRVKSYHVDVLLDNQWKTVSKGTTIGYKKLDPIEDIQASKIRLIIDDARGCPLISEFGLHYDPREYEG